MCSFAPDITSSGLVQFAAKPKAAQVRLRNMRPGRVAVLVALMNRSLKILVLGSYGLFYGHLIISIHKNK